MLGQPGQHGLAQRGGVGGVGGADRAGIDPHRMPALALQQGDDRIALQHRQVHRLAGLLADALHMRLGAARQIHLLEERLRQMQPAGAQRVAPARRPRHVAPLHQRGEQVVARRDIELGALCQLGELQAAGGAGQRIDQRQRPINRLDAVAPPSAVCTGGRLCRRRRRSAWPAFQRRCR